LPYFGVHDPFSAGGYDVEKAIAQGWDVREGDEDIDSLVLRLVDEVRGQRFFGKAEWVLNQIDADFSELRITGDEANEASFCKKYRFRCQGLRYRISEFLTEDTDEGIWTFEIHFDDDSTPA
jgi:hypothetical protein